MPKNVRCAGKVKTGPRGGKFRTCAGGKKVYVRKTKAKRKSSTEKRPKKRVKKQETPIMRSPDHTQTPPPPLIVEEMKDRTKTPARPTPMSISSPKPAPAPLLPVPMSVSSPPRPVLRAPVESLTKIPRGANYMIDPRMRQYFPEPFSDYKQMRELGRGNYGAVYLAEHKPTRVKVALKVVNEIDDMEAFNLIALRLAKGSDTPLKMRQNHIVPILATGLLPDGRVFIVSELMDGSLSSLHEDVSAGSRVRGMRDILLGVRYIHSIGMVHNDLHSANILHKRGEFFIGDFGLACTMYPIKNMVMKECLLTRKQWVIASFIDVYRATGSFFYEDDAGVIEKAAPGMHEALRRLERRYVYWDEDRGENIIVKGAYDEGAPKYVDEALLLVQRHLDKVAALQYN